MSKKQGEEKQEKEEQGKGIAIKIVVAFIFITLIAVATFFTYAMFFNREIFQDVTVEIGTSIPDKTAFLVEEEYVNEAELLTDLSNIDINKIGDYEVELSYKDKVDTVMLHLVDTTKPEVVFQDVFKNIDYEINPEDFVKEMTDLSEMTVELEDIPDISEYGEYKVNVLVKDSSRKYNLWRM